MKFDFHIHSGLSACAEKVMSPRQFLKRAKEKGLDVIAITDHNASANVRLSIELSAEFDLRVIPGMEVCTSEDIHMLALFEKCPELADFQALVDEKLPPGENPVEIFGYQIIYDKDDEIVDIDDKLRQIGITLDMNRLISEIKSRNGVVIASHVFREKFSLTSQLGFIDSSAGFDALEISARQWVNEKYSAGKRISGYPVITSSDAHFLDFVGKIYMEIESKTKNLHEIIKSLK